MSSFTISIDGHAVEASAGQTVLEAARKLGIEIPTLCYLEKCGPLNSCLVCLVKINGKLVPSCGLKVTPGMVVESETNEVHEARRTALELLFSDHVGDCLAPCNRLCPLGMAIPVMIRQIQTGKLEDAIGTVREALPLPSVLGRLCHHPCEQGCRRGTWDDSAAIRDMERFVADWDLAPALPEHVRARPPEPGRSSPSLPRCRAATGKSVVIVGAGPAGLAAAYYLLQWGHACTIAHRGSKGGGSLRNEPSDHLPAVILDAEIQQIERLGAVFKPSAVLGQDVTLDGLLRGFDAVLLATGEVSRETGQAWGLQMAPGGIKTNADTFQTSQLQVFAAGRAVRPMSHLVRAMADGKAAAECIHRFLLGKKVARADKPFSSVMGRLDKAELGTFVAASHAVPSVSACDTCAGFTKQEAGVEASRCLHCDCRSSGDCALQTYAQNYGADASRFRQQRRKFEQQHQPCGIVFEPGKCILCGICVKLTELAAEPLGLAFIGRGFDVRVAAPFNRTIQDGLQKVAAECVEHCPTGALAFGEQKAALEELTLASP